MTIEKFDWLKNYKDFTIESNSDDFIYIKYKGKIQATYSQTGVSESELKKDVARLEKLILNSRN